jgi:uncharacterized protein (TIGR02145 family)
MRIISEALLTIAVLIVPAVSFAGTCGDVNNSGDVNVLDITYLINYVYKGGPEPDCGIETGTVKDIDGNTYATVKIGDQWWMAENLKVTHYRNGEIIPNVTDNSTWAGLTTGAYCEYNNDIANVAVYGRLYNWYAVDDNRDIAPAGWHVPTDAEWQILVDYLGGDAAAGGKMKDTGTVYWVIPNTGATNESGFTGLPGGIRDASGYYGSREHIASFWSSTGIDNGNAWSRHLNYYDATIYRNSRDKVSGLSVRCVKD